jgi:predicted porin
LKTRLTLLAAATLTLPTLAMSQTSTVEIYGRLDMSVNLQKTSSTATTASQSRKFVSADTPWLGFRGTEDLGGGLRAYFKIEHGFAADTGALASPVPGQFWNRESLVGLGSATFGSVQLGSQFTPSLWFTGRIDPFRRSNTGAIFPMFQQGLAGPLGYTAAFNNSVQYISPSLAGLQAKVLVGATEGVAPGGKPLSTAFEYTLGKSLFAGVTYDKVKIAGAAVGLPAQPSVDLITTQVGLTYNFDVAKLHGYWIRTKPDGAPGMKGGMLGVSVPVGAGEIAASVQKRDAEDAANSDAQTVALQYSYFLSKRTLVYVGGARQTNKGNATFGIWPSRLDAGPSPAAADLNGYQLGMRHYF